MLKHQHIISIGPHKLLCGDITNGAVSSLMGDSKADVIYSDPPWGPGNQKYWHTMNKRGSKPRTNWIKFLEYFSDVCATYRKHSSPVFIEMGTRWVGDLNAAMKNSQLCLVRRWEIFYGPKSKPLKNTVSLYGTDCANIALPNPPHGEPVTKAILTPVVCKNTVVLDPCAGRGMTARITHALDGIFYGVELNKARLSRVEVWLRKHAK